MKKKTLKIISLTLAAITTLTIFAGVVGTINVSATSLEETVESETLYDETYLSEDAIITDDALPDENSVLSENENDVETELEAENDDEVETERLETEIKDEDNNQREDEITENLDGKTLTTLRLQNIAANNGYAEILITVRNKETKEKLTYKITEDASFTTRVYLEPGEYKITSVTSEDYNKLKLSTKTFVIGEKATDVSVEFSKTEVNEGFAKHFIKNNAFLLLALLGVCAFYGVIKFKNEHK